VNTYYFWLGEASELITSVIAPPAPFHYAYIWGGAAVPQDTTWWQVS